MTEQNWAGNIRYSTSDLRRPSSVDEVREIVASSRRLKALGSRHSFSTIADTDGTLLSLEALPFEPELAGDGGTVRVPAGATFAQLAPWLEARGRALGNLASLPHISVVGSVQTGTHGSGARNPAFSAHVVAVEVVRADGRLEVLESEHPDFAATVVGIGALGVVVAVRLRTEPSFRVAQHVFEGAPWSAVLEHWEALTASAYSVSVFTTFAGHGPSQIWVKEREGEALTFDPRELGATVSSVPLHPLPGVEADSVTEQLGRFGPWHERLPHFRAEFQPSHGDEVQSEYLLPAERAVDAIDALWALGERIAPILHAAEIRRVAADDAWLSPSGGRDSVALHFTWQKRTDEIVALLPEIESVLAPVDARPHWGKVFTMGADDLHRVYPRLRDFAALRNRVDPDRVFDNEFLRRALG